MAQLTTEAQNDLKDWLNENYDAYTEDLKAEDNLQQLLVEDAISQLDFDDQDDEVRKHVNAYVGQFVRDRSAAGSTGQTPVGR